MTIKLLIGAADDTFPITVQQRSSLAPADAFRLDEVKGVAVVPGLAQGRKCARSWKVSPEVGTDPRYPEVTPRDARALAEWDAAHAA